MKFCFDHIVIAVADLDASEEAYSALLGRKPSWRGSHPALGTRNLLFRLSSTLVELLAGDDPSSPLGQAIRASLGELPERAFALALGTTAVDDAVRAVRERGLGVTDALEGEGTDTSGTRRRTWRSAFVDPASVRGLRLILIERTSSDDMPQAEPTGDPASAASDVDHIVIATDDLDQSLAIWTERLFLREDWRREFPARNTRNLGLDLGGLMVELIQRTDRQPSGRSDRLWGIAFRVADCEAAVQRLRRCAIDVTDVRDGLAPRTRVATVRWNRTPTLLIEHIAK